MDYKIVMMKASSGFTGPKFEAAAEKLAEEVRQQLANGWEPQGGVSCSFNPPYLLQALSRRR